MAKSNNNFLAIAILIATVVLSGSLVFLGRCKTAFQAIQLRRLTTHDRGEPGTGHVRAHAHESERAH